MPMLIDQHGVRNPARAAKTNYDLGHLYGSSSTGAIVKLFVRLLQLLEFFLDVFEVCFEGLDSAQVGERVLTE